MKALVLESADHLEIRDIPEPSASAGECIVSVKVAGIGGSEVLALANPGIRPLGSVMGHGILAMTPDGHRVAVNPLRGCGTCRYCADGATQLCDDWQLIGVQTDGGFAERVAVPSDALVELPQELSWEQASFVEPFANAVGAWDKVAHRHGDDVLVIGAGGLGLGLLACAKAWTTGERVEVLEASPQRSAAARQIVDAPCLDVKTRRFDVVFDTVGSVETRTLALQLANKGGTVVLLGFAAPAHELAVNDLIRHEQCVVGSFVYSADQFRRAIELAALTETGWVTDVAWHEVGGVLGNFRRGDYSIVKVALRPSLA